MCTGSPLSPSWPLFHPCHHANPQIPGPQHHVSLSGFPTFCLEQPPSSPPPTFTGAFPDAPTSSAHQSCLSGCLIAPTAHIGQPKSETRPVSHSFSPHVTHPTGKGLHPSEPRWEAHPWGGRRGGAVSPGGCQDEAEDAIGVLGQLLQDGEDEGGRLAAARLGTSQAVPAWDKQDNSIDTVQTRFAT